MGVCVCVGGCACGDLQCGDVDQPKSLGRCFAGGQVFCTHQQPSIMTLVLIELSNLN
jgi:hypothetical protein